MNVLDEFGDQMFGRRIRLRVLLWAAEQPDAFNQSQAARGIDYSASGEVAKELERLVRLGMLTKFGREPRVGPQRYMRSEHPGWAIAEAARVAIKKISRMQEEEPDMAQVGGGGTTHARVQHVRGNDTA